MMAEMASQTTSNSFVIARKTYEELKKQCYLVASSDIDELILKVQQSPEKTICEFKLDVMRDIALCRSSLVSKIRDVVLKETQDPRKAIEHSVNEHDAVCCGFENEKNLIDHIFSQTKKLSITISSDISKLLWGISDSLALRPLLSSRHSAIDSEENLESVRKIINRSLQEAKENILHAVDHSVEDLKLDFERVFTILERVAIWKHVHCVLLRFRSMVCTAMKNAVALMQRSFSEVSTCTSTDADRLKKVKMTIGYCSLQLCTEISSAVGDTSKALWDVLDGEQILKDSCNLDSLKRQVTSCLQSGLAHFKTKLNVGKVLENAGGFQTNEGNSELFTVVVKGFADMHPWSETGPFLKCLIDSLINHGIIINDDEKSKLFQPLQN